MSVRDTAVSAFHRSPAATDNATDQKGVFTMGTKIYVGYLRVSTDRQGKSGLGLEAQRAAIASHINGNLSAEFVEVESGRRDQRPELKRALDYCRRTSAVLIVSKLDRLSRNAAFLLSILNSTVDVVFVDMPQVSGPTGRFLLTSMAAVAELEAGLCSQRTKEALQAAKRRGVHLGAKKGESPLTAFLQAHGNGAGVAGNVQAAKDRAEPWRETMETMIRAGMTAYGIAKELTARGETTSRGSLWTTCAVARLIRRLEIENLCVS